MRANKLGHIITIMSRKQNKFFQFIARINLIIKYVEIVYLEAFLNKILIIDL